MSFHNQQTKPFITTPQQQPQLTPPHHNHHHHHPHRNLFILKSISIIITLTILVLGINYYLILNCPKQDEQLITNSIASNNPSSSSSSSVIKPSQESSNQTTITISVYYEVLCPDSKHFIIKQLVPVYKKYRRFLNVRLVPFGKASVAKGMDGGGYEFSCQHGPEECHGNKLHGCIISSSSSSPTTTNNELSKHNPTKSTILDIISCSMGSYKLWASSIQSIDKATRDCVVKYVPEFGGEDMIMCSDGNELLARFGYETLGLKPSASFIPTVGVDGDLSNQREILRDFDSVICRKVKDKFRSDELGGVVLNC